MTDHQDAGGWGRALAHDAEEHDEDNEVVCVYPGEF